MVKSVQMVILIFIASFVVTACSPKKSADTLVVTKVTESGTDEGKIEFCSDFSLSQRSAQAFLQQARTVTVEELHNSYDHLPCYTRGEAKLGKEKCHWEIRAGNTGELMCDSGTTKLLACDDCLPAQ